MRILYVIIYEKIINRIKGLYLLNKELNYSTSNCLFHISDNICSFSGVSVKSPVITSYSLSIYLSIYLGLFLPILKYSYLSIYLSIYLEREREREREKIDTHTYTITHICICIYLINQSS